ncbi:MAG: hypothetical protein H0X24_08735 [Ktedonobacterales bacterium]|nr:hypothetical protein [Ktedonobacterales bacterium]
MEQLLRKEYPILEEPTAEDGSVSQDGTASLGSVESPFIPFKPMQADRTVLSTGGLGAQKPEFIAVKPLAQQRMLQGWTIPLAISLLAVLGGIWWTLRGMAER